MDFAKRQHFAGKLLGQGDHINGFRAGNRARSKRGFRTQLEGSFGEFRGRGKFLRAFRLAEGSGDPRLQTIGLGQQQQGVGIGILHAKQGFGKLPGLFQCRLAGFLAQIGDPNLRLGLLRRLGVGERFQTALGEGGFHHGRHVGLAQLLLGGRQVVGEVKGHVAQLHAVRHAIFGHVVRIEGPHGNGRGRDARKIIRGGEEDGLGGKLLVIMIVKLRHFLRGHQRTSQPNRLHQLLDGQIAHQGAFEIIARQTFGLQDALHKGAHGDRLALLVLFGYRGQKVIGFRGGGFIGDMHAQLLSLGLQEEPLIDVLLGFQLGHGRRLRELPRTHPVGYIKFPLGGGKLFRRYRLAVQGTIATTAAAAVPGAGTNAPPDEGSDGEGGDNDPEPF